MNMLRPATLNGVAPDKPVNAPPVAPTPAPKLGGPMPVNPRGPGLQGLPMYHKGTDYVPKTGPAVLKKGEAVLNNEDAEAMRKSKGKAMDNSNVMSSLSASLGGKKEKKPKKEIKEIRTRKSKNGGYVHEHHHTAPEHHPMEEHTSADQDAMAEHMMQNMGTPNPGEAEADAGQSGAPDAAPAAGAPAGASAGTPPPAAA